MPGTWRISPVPALDRYVIAAFVKSPLRLESAVVPFRRQVPPEIHVRAKAPRQWIPKLAGSATLDLLPTTAIRDQQQILNRDRQWLDAIRFRFPVITATRPPQRRDCDRIRLENFSHVEKDGRRVPLTYRLKLPSKPRRGIYNVKAKVVGSAPRIGSFERTLVKTLVVT